MIRRYDSVITIIDKSKNKMLALKFKIIDGHLYAYNMYNSIENRRMLEISKINNVDVSQIINHINENDLYDVESLKKYGINTEDQFVLSMLDGNSIVNFDVSSVESDDNIFYKKHDINENISDKKLQIENIGSVSQNLMLDYASTNFKALLKILKSNCLSQTDKNNVDRLLKSFELINDNYGNATDNLDMLFLSSQLLLMVEDKIDYLPEEIISFISNNLKINFVGENLEEENSLILTSGKVDYLKIVNKIRNALAHSNYRVLDNGLIEFYEDGKKGRINLHFTVSKIDVKQLFNRLYNYKYLEGTFPHIYSNKLINTPNSFNQEELLDYLDQIILYDITNYQIIKEKENDIGLDLYYFDKSENEDQIEFRFNQYIKPHLNDDCCLIKHKLNNQDKKYVLDSIKEMGEKYFFNLSNSAQRKVIEQLLKYRYNKKYELIKNIDEILETSYDSNDSLTKKSSDYMNLKAKIELTITALLNTLFIFCHGHNKSTIEASNIRFPESLYKQYMDSNIKNFYELSKESSDYQKIYISLLKAAPTHLIEDKDVECVAKRLDKIPKDMKKIEAEIYLSSKILEGSATLEDYNQINKGILLRFRNCLAHGRLVIENIDINNISSTKLIFYDTDNGRDNFEATVTLENLLNSINQNNFLTTMFNSNENFIRHSL